MAAPRLAKQLSALKHRRQGTLQLPKKGTSRRLHLEPLEDRRVMAVGPSLVAVVPNNGVFLHTNDMLNVAPRDLTFRFAQGNAIDPATLGTGIVLKSGGADHILGDADDQILTPGFLGLGDTPREVIMRFAANLPDNVYSVTLVGSGLTPLKDTSGSPYSSGDPLNLDTTIKFTLDLGAKVDAIVPQPISRNAVNNVLTQKNDTIDVYFDQPMSVSASDPARATNPAFYRLIDATSGAITLPQSVSYSEDATLTVLSAGMTTLSYNGVSATTPLTINNQTTRVSVISGGTNNKGTFTLTVNGATTTAIPAFGATATSVLSALSVLPGMAGNVAVTPTTSPGTVEQFDITFQGALTGRSVPVLFSPAGGAVGSLTTTVFASNLPASGGSGAASSIQNNLASIPALAGKVTVTGPNGGPYTIQFTGTLAGTNVSPIVATTTAALPPPTPLPPIVSITSQPKASLVFASAIPPGTQKLEIGTSPEPRALESTSNAQHLGNSMTTPLQAYLGDSLLLSGNAQANDVDLYRFDLQNAVSDFAVTVTPKAGSTLDTQIRIFDANGTPVQAIDNPGAGVADAASGISLNAGTYYVGVSSTGNSSYNAATGAGATGGTTTGSYALQVTFSDLPAVSQTLELLGSDTVSNDPTTYTYLSYGGVQAVLPLMVINQRTDVVITDAGPGGSGSFTLTINGFTTGPIPATGAAPGDVQAAIDAIPELAGNIFVGGASVGPGAVEAFALNFEGSFTGKTVPVSMNLLGGAIGTATTGANASVVPAASVTAGMVQANLNLIPVPGGSFSVSGPTGGPFNVNINGAVPNPSLITSNTANVRVTVSTDDRYIGPGNSGNVNNSSFDTASTIGVLGSSGRTLGGSIAASPNPLDAYTIDYPGSGDAPGSRLVQYVFNSHIQTPAGVSPDPTPGVEEITYDFQSFYGYTPQGSPLFNAITENQKQRAREAFELIAHYTGIQFREVDPLEDGSVPADISVVTGDVRAIGPLDNVATVGSHEGFPNIPANQQNNPLNSLLTHEFTVISSSFNWGNSEFGGQWFINAMDIIGKAIGLGYHDELPDLTPYNQSTNNNLTEHVFPSSADVLFEQALHRPESNDIDLYKFTVTEPGLFRAETVAERLASSTAASPDLLNTVLTLYKETTDPQSGVKTRTEIARNDDYYGNDSYLELSLGAGTYYVAVTSTGNTQFDPTILNTGAGGRTQGAYDLTMSLRPDTANTSMRDATGVSFDGDADGNAGGRYQFWFQSNTPAATSAIFYVDKTFTGASDGTLAKPYNTLSAALAAANTASKAKNADGTLKYSTIVVRVEGNGGTDGVVSTLSDDQAYLVGFKDPNLLQPLADGGSFKVPQNTTVMVDAGAIFKMRRSNLNAGTTPQGLVSQAGGSIQVLGTPTSPVRFTSYADTTMDTSHSAGAGTTPQGGDYGGITLRDDSDHERDFLSPAGSTANPFGLTMPVFLNYINNASMTYAGGKVTVDTVEDQYDPITMNKARPTLSYNTITKSGHAGMSATPNTFDDDGLNPTIAFGQRRVGPDIHDNTIVNNSINGLFISIATQAGSPLDYVDLTTRWKATDIVYVVQESLVIAGTPGGSISPGTPNSTAGGAPLKTILEDGRLRIDPGVTVKLSSRIETKISSQFIAEGTSTLPIVFTSLKDDKYGAGGSFDTNNDGSLSGAAPGQWGGFYFGPASTASLDHTSILYAGGVSPIEGTFANFNAIDVEQADLRLTNSILKNNAGGGNAANNNRNGRGTNADAVIFVRGAQPIIVNNIIRDNSLSAAGVLNATGPAISINANSMTSDVEGDYGRSTGGIDRFTQYDDNHGPLVRGNRLLNNTLNGMRVREETLTTETIWDDTDIAHIVLGEIIADNLSVYGGLRLQSSPSASLVVKLQGDTAGLTASGTPLDVGNRIGGTVQVIGQPGFPVVMTSLSDDTVAAGFDPSGLPVFDTNNGAPPPGLPTGPEVNNGLLIDDDVPTNTVGHFEARPGAGGDVSQSGVTVQGNTQLLINQDFLFEYTNYVSVGGQVVNLGTTNITLPPTLVAPDLVVSEGNFPVQNSNQVIQWHVETRFDNGVATMFNTITFSSNQALGNLQLISYLDEDVQGLSDDLLYPKGTPGQSNFRLYTLDGPQRIGFSQGGVYTPGPGLVNATYDGFAADRFAGLLTAITGGTATFSVNGNINTTNLRPFSDPQLGAVYGLGDVTSAMAWSVAPASSTATITSFLELVPRNPAANGGDWRSIKLDQNSNDTNVAEILESEPAYVGANGSLDNNRAPAQAQFLGALAPNDKSGDDTRRLGFQVDGNIAADNPTDVDVYSFTADSGTEVWFDIDRTSAGLDAMLELVDADGNVIASATNTALGNPVVTPTAPPNIIVPPGTANNSVQQISLGTPAGATAYNFQLSYAANGTTFKTGPISSTATAATVQAALLAIPGVNGNPPPFVAGDLTVSGPAGGPWTVTFGGNFANVPVALLSGGNLPLPGLNANITPGVLPGDIGLAQSFDKDYSNGRDTFSTNAGGLVPAATGTITAVSNTFPSVITSPNHGLASGDQVQIGNTRYTIQVLDPNSFALKNAFTTVSAGATWTKLVQTTRDPIMRVVLPNAANGTPLKNSPFFLRVRSQPASFTGESGNTLNPGLTSGQYQLQVRVNQADQKPGSTVRFADIRFATNGIEVHGLPQHSPLAGDTAEADTANGSAGNDNRAGAQFLGNLLMTDKNSISVGGQISNLNDVDWYQFDLNAPLTQIFGGGLSTFATMFDIDYGDGLARPDTTLSVFDSTGRLIYVGRDSGNQADQPGVGQGLNADDLSRGSFGQFDPSIGSIQLPAGKTTPSGTFRSQTYYVAVSTSRNLPTALDQTFTANPTDANVRLEPIDSLGRIVEDHLNGPLYNTTAQLADNQYFDSQTGAAKSTFMDLTDKKTLSANVQPFNLGDVSLFVSQAGFNGTNQTHLSVVNPLTGIRDMDVGTLDAGTVQVDDLTMRGDGTLWAYESVFTGNPTGQAGNIYQVDPATAQMTLLGSDGITDQPTPPTTPPTIQSVQQVTTNRVGAAVWAGRWDSTPAANAARLYLAVDDPATGASTLYLANWANGSTTLVQGQPWGRLFGNNISSPLELTAATRATGNTNFGIPGIAVTFQSTAFGGPNRIIHITSDGTMKEGTPPVVSVDPGNANDVDVVMNPNGATASSIFTYGASNGGIMQLTAVNEGAAGNSIQFTFSRPIGTQALPAGAPPTIKLVGTTVQVTLNARPGSETTGQQLADAINDPANGLNNLVTAQASGDTSQTFTTAPAAVTLSGGINPTTIQDLVNAVNAKAAVGIIASFSPSDTKTGNLIIGKTPNRDVALTGSSGQTGFTRGLAFAPDTNTLFGVSDGGQFFQVDLDARSASEASSGQMILFAVDVTVPGLRDDVSQPPLRFSGLARGPLDLNNGEFANDFFATTSTGQLVCLDSNGNALQVFDSNGDGVADSSWIQMVQGGTNLGTPMTNITGLAFSNLDFNLWHPTATRGGDAGHNIDASPDHNASRSVPVPANANTSFYFGFEKAGAGAADQYDAFPSTANTVTSTVNATVSNQQISSNVANATIDSGVDNQITPTTTQFTGNQFDSNLSSVDGAYKGLTLKWTQGANAGTSSVIQNYIGATHTFTLAAALPTAPAPFFDQFQIVVATASQFNGDPSLSAVDGAYTGKLLTFPSGPLQGQSHIITNYVGATRTFSFGVSFAAPPSNGDGFVIQPATPATAQRFDGDASLSNKNNEYNGSVLKFTSGALTGEQHTVSGYIGSSHTFLFATPFSAAPGDQDQFTLTISTPVPPELLPDGGQYGVLARNQPQTGSEPNSGITLPRTLTQDELLNNPSIANSYNFPGGAYGKLYSDPFSLSGVQASDKPSFYFTYFLDTDNGTSGLGNQRRAMTDSARVFIGPFTRVNAANANSFVSNSSPAKDTFNGGQGLSTQDDFYTGQAVQFSSGVLTGQAQVITKYIGATRTFVFGSGFTASPAFGDSFIIGSAAQAWDLVATNNPLQDLSTTSTIEGELPTFLSQSNTDLPANQHQQVQELFNANEWRQARIDLSRYAGFDNLKLRFDFSTAGTVNRTDVRLGANAFGTNNVFEDPSYGGTFGNLGSTARLQNNQHQGFFLDDFIVGLAGRGEMVTNAPQDSTFFNPPAPQPLQPGVNPPAQVPSGPYQLEIRRGTDYGVNFDTGDDRIQLVKTFDVNEQELANNRQVISSPTVGDGFESGTLGGNQFVSWGSSGNAPWSATSAQAGSGKFSAASGAIGNGQTSALLATVVTGAGQISFSRSIQSDIGDVLRFYIDGQIAVDRNGNQAQWSGDLPFQTFAYDISAGRHTFRWAYEKDAAPPVNPGLDQAFIDDVAFPTPQVGVADIYDPGSPDYTTFIDPVLHSGSGFVNLPGGGSAFVPNGFLHVGDQNVQRAQGHIQIEQNSIDNSAQNGILIDTGPRDASTNNPYASVRNLPTLNTDRLVPGVTVTDNVVSNSGAAGITFNGDGNAPTSSGQLVPVSAVPFGRIVNNTIYGSLNPFGTGIQVGVNAGPTLLNNIIANTTTGIAVNPASIITTVIGANLYSNNTTNASAGVTLGSNAIFLQPTDPLFKNPATRNFYLVPGSQAIDSSLNTLADRPSIAAVKSAVGIPQSPILAPDKDLYGQLRVDDPNQNPPPGLGQNIFKDRGAVERADFSAPTASVSDPLDNDNNHRDRNLAVNDVAIRNENLTQFVLKLSDVGIGIDPATVTSSQFTLSSDGVQLFDQSAAVPDYRFVYNQSTNEVFFIPAAGIWPLNHTYTIGVNNTASGVLDLAGNPIAANRDDGTTTFNIFVGILYSFGDAPDPTYPSRLASNGAVHQVVDGFHLGATVVEKSDATPTPNADGNQNPDGTSSDDGIKFKSLSAGYSTSITVTAAIPAGMTGKLDAWIDLNHDGVWTANEKVIDHNLTPGAGNLVNGTNTITFTVDANAVKGPTFARFRFSSTGVDSPTGFGSSTAIVAPDGEVEDYKVVIGGPPYQNPNNALDVNNDGLVTPGDALTIINYINLYVTNGQNFPLPSTTTNFPPPEGKTDALGNPIKGQGNYVDVNGNGNLEAADALMVINYINSRVATGGSGEGEGAATATSQAVTMAAADASTLSGSSDSTIVPPVLYASSSVVVESQPAASQQPLLVAQASVPATTTAADQAILDLQSSGNQSDTSERRLSTAVKTKLPAGPLSESAWDDLLLSLASDQAKQEGTQA